MATIERRGDSYRAIFRFAGRRFTRSLATSNKREALASLARLDDNLRRAELGLLIPPEGVDIPAFLLSDGKLAARPSLPTIVTLHELVENYFGSLPKGALEAITLQGMRIHQGHLERGLGIKFPIQGLEAAHLQKYIEGRSKAAGFRGRDISGATIKKEIVTLRTIWNWSRHMGFVKNTFPNRGLRYPKLQEKPPFQTLAEIEARIKRWKLTTAEEGDLWDCSFLSLDEVGELLDEVATRPVQPFAPAMFVFAAHTGARKSEILRAQLDDIDFEAGTLLIREKKRVKGKLSTRRVPLTARLQLAIREWVGIHPGGSALFSTNATGVPPSVDEAHRVFKQNVRRTRFSKLRGWHVFRHSFCTNCAARGVDQRVINAWVGHQTEEMVRRYRHLVPNQELDEIQKVFCRSNQSSQGR